MSVIIMTTHDQYQHDKYHHNLEVLLESLAWLHSDHPPAGAARYVRTFLREELSNGAVKRTGVAAAAGRHIALGALSDHGRRGGSPIATIRTCTRRGRALRENALRRRLPGSFQQNFAALAVQVRAVVPATWSAVLLDMTRPRRQLCCFAKEPTCCAEQQRP